MKLESPDSRGDLARRFGQNLRRARKRVDMSQEELAVLASLHRSEVSMLERGIRVPRLDTVVRLLGSLDAEPADFFVGIQWIVGRERRAGHFALDGEPGQPQNRG